MGGTPNPIKLGPGNSFHPP